MGKKCVQTVYSACKTLCTSWVYAQVASFQSEYVGNKQIYSGSLLANLHSLLSVFNLCRTTDLYTVSTQPIITTICLKNKNHKTRGL